MSYYSSSRLFKTDIPIIPILICYLAVMSIITLIMYGHDKSAAKHHKHRIPEKTLYLMNLLGGAAGGWIGMYLFRHKTKHKNCYAVQLISALLWCGITAFVIIRTV